MTVVIREVFWKDKSIDYAVIIPSRARPSKGLAARKTGRRGRFGALEAGTAANRALIEFVAENVNKKFRREQTDVNKVLRFRR